MDLNLADCTEPATARIEAYSPRESLHGSLDAVAYACVEHAAAARDAIHAEGLTAFQCPGLPVVERTCGTTVDFTTSSKH